MFGFLYASYLLACRLWVSFTSTCKDSLSRKWARDSGDFAYWDSNGAYRLVSDGRQIRYVELENGDRTIQTLDGSVIRNISKEKRDKRINEQNYILARQGSKLKLLGRFCDVCSDKMNTGKWCHVKKKVAVYQDGDGNLYFREPTFNNNCRRDVYITVDEGRYTFIDKPTEYEKNWLDMKNKALNIGVADRIHLSRSVDVVV